MIYLPRKRGKTLIRSYKRINIAYITNLSYAKKHTEIEKRSPPSGRGGGKASACDFVGKRSV